MADSPPQSRIGNAPAPPRLCLLVLALCLPALSLADTALRPHTAEYKVKISVLGGQLKTELRETDSGYVATHVVRATGMSRMLSSGLIRDRSEFAAAEDGVRPVRFLSSDTLSRDKINAAINFDWENGEAYGTVNGTEITSAVANLVHDRVSIQYELMFDLLNGEPSAQYSLYDVDEIKTVNVRNIGSRDVKVPAGKFKAIGIQHQAVGSKRIMTMWCVPELGFLPVIIEQHRKGKLRFQATLKQYKPLPDQAAVRSK